MAQTIISLLLAAVGFHRRKDYVQWHFEAKRGEKVEERNVWEK